MKTAFVTGATRKTGRAIAIALSRSGWRVLALGRDRSILEALRADHGIEPLAMDLTDRDEMRAIMVNQHIDALVIATMRWPDTKPYVEYTEAEIDMAMEVNLAAALHLTRNVLPVMAARKSGAMVFVGPGKTPMRSTVQTTAEAAMTAFAAALAAEYAESGLIIQCLDRDGQQPNETATRVVQMLDILPQHHPSRPATVETIY
ncbi:SDR family oxidoreductase [Paracoccus sp. R12_1]|uniref:SDR family oxidoreductase n=1 Tax=unclassified Paracoccus (in: a-proteobacteria) TaxID=2688777 RepID=UPI001ADD486B|nr:MULTISPECIES: SDR family oxidoreductase [unclassified Paracoccus (in: a-proteobacteria)]MBO9456999.1 SDR family oxidoreductase [Paracoccus sp. R12_2]MBO9488116.1 SDR family oxidoreductase [Paracoccus sp. R12_1]